MLRVVTQVKNHFGDSVDYHHYNMTSSTTANPSTAPMNRASLLLAESFDDSTMSSERETTWLQPFHRSWEEIGEDESGILTGTLELANQRSRHANILPVNAHIIERGVIRYVYLIIDFSAAQSVTDFRPNRRTVALAAIETFLISYFDQNPLSQCGIILVYNSTAERITSLSTQPQSQILALRTRTEDIILEYEKMVKEQKSNASSSSSSSSSTANKRTSNNSGLGGEFSLYNGLMMARQSLAAIPPYGSREVLIIMSSLFTTDANDVGALIRTIKQEQATLPLTVNVIHLAAEVHIVSELTTVTNGRYSVALNKDHLQTLLSNHLLPPALSKSSSLLLQRRWMRMGFPIQSVTVIPVICSCHSIFVYTYYTCPTCKSHYCEIPCECAICNLTLVSSPQLARSYHHILPVKNYNDITDKYTKDKLYNDNNNNNNNNNNNVNMDITDNNNNNNISSSSMTDRLCYGCQYVLRDVVDLITECPDCHKIFCIECDEFVHQNLHTCPGCINRPPSNVKRE